MYRFDFLQLQWRSLDAESLKPKGLPVQQTLNQPYSLQLYLQCLRIYLSSLFEKILTKVSSRPLKRFFGLSLWRKPLTALTEGFHFKVGKKKEKKTSLCCLSCVVVSCNFMHQWSGGFSSLQGPLYL